MTSFPRPNDSSGGLPNSSSGRPCRHGLPQVRAADVRSPAPRGPGRPGTAGGAPFIEVGLRGVGGGSHRLAGPVASNSTLQAVRHGHRWPHARRSGASESPPLDAAPSVLWSNEPQTLCALGPGVQKNPSAQGQGHPQAQRLRAFYIGLVWGAPGHVMGTGAPGHAQPCLEARAVERRWVCQCEALEEGLVVTLVGSAARR